MQTNNASRAPTECSAIFAFSVLSNGNAQSVFLPDKVTKNINLANNMILLLVQLYFM